MSTWTHAARLELENYFTRLAPSLKATGADPAEVVEDLRQHLEREIAAERLTAVTEADVRRLLARIGAPEPVAETIVPVAPATPPVAAAPERRKQPGLLVLLGGVVLPAATLLIEWATRMCAGAFFDPLPTLAHGLLVAAVPVLNGWAWRAAHRGESQALPWLIRGNGLAAGIGLFYTVVFLPLMLPGLFAMVFFGWGLLPWSPALALASTLSLRRHLRRLPASGERAGVARYWPALLAGVGALVLLGLPVWLTRWALDQATSGEATAVLRGVRLLRLAGHETTMLRACYGRSQGAANMDLVGLVLTGGRLPSPDQAREVYYRVTGRPFNVVPPPEVRTGRGVFAELNDWTWDEDQGGEQVGGRVAGLTLRTSRLDTVVEPEPAIGYCEWILEFQNDANQPREARAQIQLPPGGVVSRLTLWVRGEEREAAFAGRAQVREAYEDVAIQRRRDPVLVTTAGPDRVLLQCFPVPANGGTMRVRLGLTVPLRLSRADEALFFWPHFVERNFSLREDFRHALWLGPVGATNPAAGPPGGDPATRPVGRVNQRVRDSELAAPGAVVRLPRRPDVREAWTTDARAPSARAVRQTLEEVRPAPLRRLVLILDGSLPLAAVRGTIARVVRGLPEGLPVEVFLAGDEVVRLAAAERGPGPPGRDALAARIERAPAVGGQDNVPALVQALDQAVEADGTAVLWIHGPQPMLLTPAEPIRQVFERRLTDTTLDCLAILPGPNRVIEQLDGLSRIRAVPRLGGLEADLTAALDRLSGREPVFRLQRSVVPEATLPETPERVPASFHLARLWAAEEIRRQAVSGHRAEAVRLAGVYQLVTPWSGAVVLETQAQFAEHGLHPVDATTVPAIPEPSTWALGVLGAAALVWARRRAGRRAAGGGGGQMSIF